MSGTRTVVGNWRGGYRCDVQAGDFLITVDEPIHVGGTNQGPEPTALLLASVASCFTISVAYAAKKQSVELRDLNVSVTGAYDGPKFRSIWLECQLDCDETKIPEILRTAQQVCYVTNTLKANAEISVTGSPMGAAARGTEQTSG